MSYSSHSVFDAGTRLDQVREVAKLLGYVKVKDGLSVPDRTDCMMWFEPKDYKSWYGVELDLYKKGNEITLTTRSTVSRSYWDLVHQNHTLKTLRDLFGGFFETDAGRNRYWRPDGKPPLPMVSGCLLARWRFNNALIKPRIYLQQRVLTGQISKAEPTGISTLDEMNPRLFSNNLILPFLVAIWEEYFKSTYIVLLRYCDNQELVLKKARLSHTQLEGIAAGYQDVETALAETLSFQRPSKIAENFRMISANLDISGALKKPYRRRKISLYESIETWIEIRNEFVHSGTMDLKLTDKVIGQMLSDFEVAVDRAYDAYGRRYNFTPLRGY